MICTHHKEICDNNEEDCFSCMEKEIISLRIQLKNAQAEKWPPASVQEALNSGDGVYRP